MQNKKKANWGSLARLLRFLWQDYKLSLSIAFVLIVVASLATVNLTASIQSLVDVYVQPMLKSGSHDFGPLLRFLTSVAVFCLIGVIANYVSSLLMATISQDSLRSFVISSLLVCKSFLSATLTLTNTVTSCLSTPTTSMLSVRLLSNLFHSCCKRPLPLSG